MSRHIVGAFAGMAVVAPFRHDAGKEIVEIGDNVGVGIFLDGQRG